MSPGSGCGRLEISAPAADADGPALDRVAPRDLDAAATPCVEDLLPTRGVGDAALLRSPLGREGDWMYSFPLPLLEAGVVHRVVPARYEAPRLDWPSPGGATVPVGSALCSIRGRTQIVLGCARETRRAKPRAPLPPGAAPPPGADADFVETCTLFVRDAGNGESATAEAGAWGMNEWTRGDLDVYDEPRPPALGVGTDTTAPPSLAHLLLDCRDGKHEIAHPATLARDARLFA